MVNHYTQYTHKAGGMHIEKGWGEREDMYMQVKIPYVRTCTGTHEWSITTHSIHMRGEGGCIIIGKGWGERENTTLTCTCMLYRHRSHTYCCVGG